MNLDKCSNLDCVYLLGSNVEDSLSPIIHKKIYDYLGINLDYVSKTIKNESALSEFVKFKINNFCFASNVTYPYKGCILNIFGNRAKLNDAVLVSKGANLILSKSENLQLYNFDGEGFLHYLNYIGCSVRNKKILILGTGSTASSIGLSLIKAGGDVSFSSRNKKTSKLDMSFFCNTLIYEYSNIKDIISNLDIIINATPVGGEIDDSNVDLVPKDILSMAKRCLTCFDVSYKSNTKFLSNSHEVGLCAHNGLGMLVSQAVLCILKIIDFFELKTNNKLEFNCLFKKGLSSLCNI